MDILILGLVTIVVFVNQCNYTVEKALTTMEYKEMVLCITGRKSK